MSKDEKYEKSFKRQDRNRKVSKKSGDFDRNKPANRRNQREESDETEPGGSSRPQVPDVPIPEGVPVAHLKSAHYNTFLYRKMISHIEGNAADGDLIAVRDKYNRFFGWGFYNSRSEILLRMFSREPDMPTDESICRRIADAVRMRREIFKLDQTTDAYRLVHAEGDGLTGLIADKFGEYVVIELFSLAMFRRIDLIEDAFIDAGLSIKGFLLRVDKSIAQQEGIVIGKRHEPKVEKIIVNEQGVRFAVDLRRGHKTGFFCDQRENRLALTKFTPGKRVLDVCCYTGGFAVYAAALGQAAQVTGVDLDENALVVAEENAALNNATIEFTHSDAFNYLRQAAREGRQWDIVIVDPSKFVPRRTALEQGLHKYADLNRLAAGVVAPGGMMITCSCSGPVDPATFVETVGRAARSANRTMQIFRQTGAGPDHPYHADTPEGQYLKVVWSRLI
ncbi:MAG: class I SAM-dependent rRNA methyltransferase [Phycisphaerae bacterium]|jgi:23S rRNA (cytosine1962-C5)-methyltransferase|nr:class I SAM-dependent rRNA methyltransferase [Phycisphaerae bacterium]